MKLITLLTIVFCFASIANAKVLEVRAKDYTCSELKALVQLEGTVHIKSFGSLDVHSSPEACDEYYEESYTTGWKTKDKWYCVAGYSCRESDDNRNR